MARPFWETDGIFDQDLNPEGLALSYVISPGSKGDIFTKVKNTLAWEQIRNLGTHSASAWMLGDQLTTTASSNTDLGLAFYYYSGLNADGAGLGAAAMGQSVNQTTGGKFLKDNMGV